MGLAAEFIQFATEFQIWTNAAPSRVVEVAIARNFRTDYGTPMPRSKLWWGYPSPRANLPASRRTKRGSAVEAGGSRNYGINSNEQNAPPRPRRIFRPHPVARPDPAVARKLAIILRRMCVDGTKFNWSTKKAVARRA